MFIASRHKRHCESRENKLTTNIRKHTNSRRTFAAGVFVSTRAPVPGYAHQNSKTGNSIHNIINCGFPCIIYFCPEIPICKSMDRRRFLKTAGLLAGGSMISGTQAINILKHQNKKKTKDLQNFNRNIHLLKSNGKPLSRLQSRMHYRIKKKS